MTLKVVFTFIWGICLCVHAGTLENEDTTANLTTGSSTPQEDKREFTTQATVLAEVVTGAPRSDDNTTANNAHEPEKKGGLSRTAVIVVSSSVPLAVILLVAGTVLLILWKKQKWCFKSVVNDYLQMNKIRTSEATHTLGNLLNIGQHILRRQFEELEGNTRNLGRSAGNDLAWTSMMIEGIEYLLSNAVFVQDQRTFLQSLWGRSVCFVIMLTKAERHAEVLCPRYWPDLNESVRCDELTVTNELEDIQTDYSYRILAARWGASSYREIHHFQFRSWNLEDCPDNAKPLVDFFSMVKGHVSRHTNPGPVLIHCSKDLSRTGSFLVLDQIVQEITASRSSFSVFDTLLTTKQRFPNVLFKTGITRSHYFFIHQCLLIYLRSNVAVYDNVYEILNHDQRNGDIQQEPIYQEMRSDVLRAHEDALRGVGERQNREARIGTSRC